MPQRTTIPRPSHSWLKPAFDYLDKGISVTYPSGASGIPNAVTIGAAVPQARVGNASGIVGLYGASGAAQIATGTAGTTGFTGVGAASGAAWWFNGGSGAYYTVGDIVTQLKNMGVLKP